MIQSVQKPLPWWQQSAPPPMPGTEEDPTQPPAPPPQRFDMPEEPQQPQQQFMPEMPQWQQPQAMASAAPQGMPDEPGTTPAPAPPAPAPAPVAPPVQQEPDPNAMGRDPVRRARMIGALEGADEARAQKPATGIGQGIAQQARDRAVQKYITDHEKKSSGWDIARQALGAAMQISPRLSGVGHVLMHPPNKTEESIPVLESAAKQEEAQQQAISGETLKQEQIDYTREARLAAIAQRIAAQKGSPATASDRLIALRNDPELAHLLSDEAQRLEWVANGSLKETLKPEKPETFGTVPEGGSVFNKSTGTITGTAPGKDGKNTKAQDLQETIDAKEEIANKRNLKGAERQHFIYGTPMPAASTTINNNWTPQQAAAAQAPVEQGQRNEAFLKTLNPQDQVIIKMLADRDYALPKGRGALEKNTKYIAGAKAYDPTFNAGNYENEYALKKSATSGPIAANMTSLNTALVHLGGLDQAASQLDNSTWKRYNTLANWLSRESGNPRTKPFQDYRTAFNAEMARALKGGVADKHEVDAWNSNIDMADSPAALKRAAQDVAHIIAGRIGQQEYQVKRGLGGKLPSNMLPFVSPEAQAVLDRLGGVAPTQQGTPGGSIRYSANGRTYNIPATEEAAFLKDHPQAVKQ